MTTALHTSALISLPLLARGKVRDNYAVGKDRLLMVASDRLSAFDVILGEPIPGKGALLTQMALFWFDKLGDICPNHLTGEAPESVVTPAEVPQVTGRSMLVKRLKPLPVEAVVRGYLIGSGWKDYQQSGEVCGIALPAGLRQADGVAWAAVSAMVMLIALAALLKLAVSVPRPPLRASSKTCRSACLRAVFSSRKAGSVLSCRRLRISVLPCDTVSSAPEDTPPGARPAPAPGWTAHRAA